MRSVALLLALLWGCASVLEADILLTGTVGQASVRMVISYYSDGAVQGYYLYDKYDTPLHFHGKESNGWLIMEEKDERGDATGKLRLPMPQKGKTSYSGEWTSLDGSRSAPIQLTWQSEYEYLCGCKYDGMVIPGSGSTADHYFEMELFQEDDRPKVRKITVKEKRTDRIIQVISPEDTEHPILHSISTEDYDFDGITDFAIVNHMYPQYAGFDYYCWDTATAQYVLMTELSELGDITYFDPETGTLHTVGKTYVYIEGRTYSWGPHHRLKLLERNCLELIVDEETGEESWEEAECDK